MAKFASERILKAAYKLQEQCKLMAGCDICPLYDEFDGCAVKFKPESPCNWNIQKVEQYKVKFGKKDK